METVQQDAFAMKELLNEDSDGLTGLARTSLEATGTTRNGSRERRLETRVGTITLRIPKPQQGAYFPEGSSSAGAAWTAP